MDSRHVNGGARVDVVVVGAGLAGSAAAWAIARRGRSVLLLEQYGPRHHKGSSHGSARIYRRAYSERLFIELTGRAGELWQELEAASGVTLRRRTGGLDHGTRRSPERLARALEECGVAAELLSPGAAQERWPGFRFDGPVVHHDDAGTLDADLTVDTLQAEAVRHGAELRHDSPVRNLVVHGDDDVELVLDEGIIRASSVVVAAGPWIAELLGGRVSLPKLTVTQQQIFHFPRRDPQSEWPVAIHKAEREVYLLPGGRDGLSPGDPSPTSRDGLMPAGGVKVAEHAEGSETTATARDGVVNPHSRERVVDYVREWLPGLIPEPYAEASCLYTSTASEDFVLDRVGPLTVASACSGQGAKFTPLIGEICADLALGTGAADPRFRLAAHAVAARSGLG